MFITKKAFEKALAEREKQVMERCEKVDWERNENRYVHERIDSLERMIHDTRAELEKMKGIKEKYDKICKAVNAPASGSSIY